MKKYLPFLLVIALFFVQACTTDDEVTVAPELSTADVDGSFAGSRVPSTGGGEPNESGLITAGEWNDLDNWDFWNDILKGEEHGEKPDHWNMYTNNRVAVQLNDGARPVINAEVRLVRNREIVWEARTDNLGRAELWISPFTKDQQARMSDYQLEVEGVRIDSPVKMYGDGTNIIAWRPQPALDDHVELAFIVDATGSMGDELEFLKKDLEDVIQRVQRDNQSTRISTGSVFYRDEEDEYVVRKSEFTDDLGETLKFIRGQSADGGGDFPEAVHTAVDKTVNELRWSDRAKTRIAFLLLDAPPHHRESVISDLHQSIKQAAAKGIKIIPITASGIDKETEFLMRFSAALTNGTYVFITNHSGIGDDHIEATVGEYEVEFLNDLMVRLIGKYSE